MSTTLDIFKPGTFTDMHGRVINFTEADLIATAKAYDPAISEAPLVIGHPKHDAPAYGWVKSLEFADELLQAEADQVDADFAEMNNSGRFKHRSASFYLPDAPNNPVPGVYYLRHVGFLGAQPPAVKGLKPASFAADEDGFVEFGDWNDRLIARMFRNIKNYLIGAIGQEKADRVIDEWDLQSITEEAVRPETSCEATAGFAEQEALVQRRITELETQLATANSQIASFQEQLSARETRIATLTTELTGVRTEQRRAEFAAFCDAHPSKISPAMRPTVISMMMKLTDADPVEFGEGGDKTTRPALEVYQDELKNLPDVVSFSETATTGRTAPPKKHDAAEFGESVDENRLDLHQKVLDFMEANPEKSYEQALDIVQKQD